MFFGISCPAFSQQNPGDIPWGLVSLNNMVAPNFAKASILITWLN
jgi:hypothetical protein